MLEALLSRKGRCVRGCLFSCFLFGTCLCVPQWKLRHLEQMSPSILTTDDFDTGGCTLQELRHQLFLHIDGWLRRSLAVRPHGSNSDWTDLDLLLQHTGGSPLYGRLACSMQNRESTEASSSPGDTILSLALMSPVFCRNALSARSWIPDGLDSPRKGKPTKRQVMQFRAGCLDHAVRKDLFHELQTVYVGHPAPKERGRGEGENRFGDRRSDECADRRSMSAFCFACLICVRNTESTGIDNGVEHAYLLAKSKWYAYYEVIQPASLLYEC